jgi:hypothetical protein
MRIMKRKLAPPAAPQPPKQATRAAFEPPQPPFRKLRGYAIDPSLVTRLDTKPVAEVTFHLPWGELGLGPKDEYLEVIDTDPASNFYYEPVNLNDPAILAQDGLPPSEGTPQFHQQMVYAVARLTIHNFEHALGRRTLWRHQDDPANPFSDKLFVQRLRIHPHALRERNAYYTPQRVALLFGYFKASADDPGGHMAGGMVFTCLSHDIVAHETTHALLDGMHRNFLNPSNPDVHAFHEGFSDIVAVFQHFTFPEILRHQIQATRGDLALEESVLSQLAGQFGRATGLKGALRNFIGSRVAGKWVPYQPNTEDYKNTKESHLRGAILVGAVFEAFLSIYKRRTEDLLRLAGDGGGILKPGAIHPDLVQRLAEEAAKVARHVLTMCGRAVDYCPPVDITFGEYLRAIITADCDVVADDNLNYRIAFIESFRKRGIYPLDVRTLSVESLIWKGPHNDELRPSASFERNLWQLRKYAKEDPYLESREELFKLQITMRAHIHTLIKRQMKTPDGPQDMAFLGLDMTLPSFEVRIARIAIRTRPDGHTVPQLIFALYQYKDEPLDPGLPNGRKIRLEGGCTVIADLHTLKIKYCVRKSVRSPARAACQRGFATEEASSLRAIYLSEADEKEPIAAIHRH